MFLYTVPEYKFLLSLRRNKYIPTPEIMVYESYAAKVQALTMQFSAAGTTDPLALRQQLQEWFATHASEFVLYVLQDCAVRYPAKEQSFFQEVAAELLDEDTQKTMTPEQMVDVVMADSGFGEVLKQAGSLARRGRNDKELECALGYLLVGMGVPCAQHCAMADLSLRSAIGLLAPSAAHIALFGTQMGSAVWCKSNMTKRLDDLIAKIKSTTKPELCYVATCAQNVTVAMVKQLNKAHIKLLTLPDNMQRIQALAPRARLDIVSFEQWGEHMRMLFRDCENQVRAHPEEYEDVWQHYQNMMTEMQDFPLMVQFYQELLAAKPQ